MRVYNVHERVNLIYVYVCCLPPFSLAPSRFGEIPASSTVRMERGRDEVKDNGRKFCLTRSEGSS